MHDYRHSHHADGSPPQIGTHYTVGDPAAYLQFSHIQKIDPGSLTTKLYAQVNASPIAISDVSTNISTITIPVRVTPISNELFDEFKANGDINVIYFRDKSYSNCSLTVLPTREDQEIVEYVFEGRPEA